MLQVLARSRPRIAPRSCAQDGLRVLRGGLAPLLLSQRRSAASPSLAPAHRALLRRGTPSGIRSIVLQATTASSSSAPPPPAGEPPSGAARARKAVVLLLKATLLWAPAMLFWLSVSGIVGPILDFRTEEEIQEDENEARRLERFFGVETLPEADYLAEWSAKEEALSQIIAKLLLSQRFMLALSEGIVEPEDSTDVRHVPSRKMKRKVEEIAKEVEVSYVLPPPLDDGEQALDGDSGRDLGAHAAEDALGGPWQPRLVVAHRGGALALVSLVFEFVEGHGKTGREERWACTQLRGDLIAGVDGEPTTDAIFYVSGPWPHGIRYMRIN
eukprot:gnl/TRDRNA2_/TRDRNA2_30239_c0_seq1.p1 gnl/TRDRNA2_/TRDRNA2_30239_c0~~gnl/TRDRNA2_/TRDRNA2_30239_c0_seq1.p1  ORF type:complete len:328 (+),score=72.29 gnl/TRDRNA2_/TRDRNA2_30239_c0_seq1:86-1069(+)